MSCARVVSHKACWRFSKLTVGFLILLQTADLAQARDEARINAAAQAFMERTSVPGLAIGVVTPAGTQVLFYGVASKETGTKVDEHTLFEIGSISKTFTVSLAAYAAETGGFRWEDPVSRHVPELKGTHLDQVSLLNLATHTTGGMPLQVPGGVKTNADLMAYFRNWAPPSAPGTTRTYANPSIGLLGVATARALNGSFAELVRDKVFKPLGLTHTFYDVPQAERQNYAQGYTRDGQPVRLSAAPLATEAYGVRATAGDLLRFVKANLGLVETGPALRRALAVTHVGHFRVGPVTQALIWEWYPLPISSEDFEAGNSDAMVLKPNPVTRLDPPQPAPDAALINKTGATNGFGAYVAFIPGRRIGLVLLANRNHPTAERLVLAEQVFAALGAPGVADRP